MFSFLIITLEKFRTNLELTYSGGDDEGERTLVLFDQILVNFRLTPEQIDHELQACEQASGKLQRKEMNRDRTIPQRMIFLG